VVQVLASNDIISFTLCRITNKVLLLQFSDCSNGRRYSLTKIHIHKQAKYQDNTNRTCEEACSLTIAWPEFWRSEFRQPGLVNLASSLGSPGLAQSTEICNRDSMKIRKRRTIEVKDLLIGICTKSKMCLQNACIHMPIHELCTYPRNCQVLNPILD
jgi:hypothetical protein